MPPGGLAAPSKLPMLLALVNTLAIAGVLGMVAYTRVLYKRPAITEQGERDRLDTVHASPAQHDAPGLVEFKTITVNIESSPAIPRPADGTPEQIQGKLHYATLGFALEVRDAHQIERVEEIKPLVMDKVLAMLGRKAFHELTTVQGRYVLRTQIIEVANELIDHARPEHAQHDALVTNVFFTSFIVQ